MTETTEESDNKLNVLNRMVLFMEFFGSIYYPGWHIATIMSSAQRHSVLNLSAFHLVANRYRNSAI